MTNQNRPLLTLALAALLGAAPALAPAPAAAQGKGHAYGHSKGKHKKIKEFDRIDRARLGARSHDRPYDRPYDRAYRDRYRDQDNQPEGRGRAVGARAVPPGQMPPPGLCRIWIDGVPPGRQPAPTDCATAVRNRPSNARVIYGDASRGTVSRRVTTSRVPSSRVPTSRRNESSTVVRDPSCEDVNRDGHHDRVLYTVDGRVVRSVCR